MNTTAQAAKALAFASIAGFFATLTYGAWHAPGFIAGQIRVTRDQLDDRIRTEADATRGLVATQLGAILRRVDGISSIAQNAAVMANRQISMFRRDVVVSRIELQNAADARAASIEHRLDAQITGIRTDIQPMIAGGNLLMRRDALPAQLLGLTAAAKVTAGETAQTAKAIQLALPKIIETVQDIGDNTKKGTQEYAKVAQDTDAFIKRMTPPYMPKWARVAIAIAGPAAQTGASVVGAGAAMGAFNK